MTHKSSQFSVLIQGPLNVTSLDNLDYYQTIGHVVISCWKTDDLSLLDGYKLDDCTVLVATPPRPHTYIKCNDNATFIYQLHSIRNGMRVVSTDFVIRTRSDETYGNLDPFLDKFAEDENKVVCGNMFFYNWGVRPFHFGDHIFVAKSKTILDAYDDMCDNDKRYNGEYCAEVAATKALLNSRGLAHERGVVKETFDVVDINLCVPFVACWNHSGRTFTNTFKQPGTITSMEEL